MDSNPETQRKVHSTCQKISSEVLALQLLLQLQMVMQVHDNYLTNTSHIEVYQGGLTTIKMQLLFFQAADKVISDPHCPCATMPPPHPTKKIDWQVC